MKTHSMEDEMDGFRPPLSLIPFEVRADLAAWEAASAADNVGEADTAAVDEERVAALWKAFEESKDGEEFDDADLIVLLKDLYRRQGRL